MRTLWSHNCESPLLCWASLTTSRALRDFEHPAYAPGANSTLAAFVRVHALAPAEYTLKPLPEELVAGKNTYVYDAHTYHTKVPPQAIARLIEQYAALGDRDILTDTRQWHTLNITSNDSVVELADNEFGNE
jgi:hypothetical protein